MIDKVAFRASFKITANKVKNEKKRYRVSVLMAQDSFFYGFPFFCISEIYSLDSISLISTHKYGKNYCVSMKDFNPTYSKYDYIKKGVRLSDRYSRHAALELYKSDAYNTIKECIDEISYAVALMEIVNDELKKLHL